MAKSQGTGFTLKEILDKGIDPIALRYFFFGAHYRSKQNYTWEALQGAAETYKKLKWLVVTFRHQTERSLLSPEKLKKIDDYRTQFISFLSNDFQIPQTVALMWEMLKSNIPSSDKLDLLFEFDQVFGLKLNEVTEEVVPEEINRLAEEREQARKQKDFKRSDELRKKIKELGYEIEDLPEGYKLKRK